LTFDVSLPKLYHQYISFSQNKNNSNKNKNVNTNTFNKKTSISSGCGGGGGGIIQEAKWNKDLAQMKEVLGRKVFL
jgi:hypothetical protein